MRAVRNSAIAAGVAVFLVLAVTGTSAALWSTTASVSSTVKVASLGDACANVTSVVNASFEEPYVTTLSQTPDGQVPGWESTPDHNIEIWVDGFQGVPAPVGRQFVELNAHVAGTLTQSISTTPGQTLQWSLLHRGRAGVDTMEVLIGASDSALVSQGNISDGVASWNRYSGAYVVPAGQTTTQLSFRAVSTATGDQSIGNFLDDVSFGSGPCLTATTTSPVSNVTNPGGDYRVGDVVEYRTTVANVGSALSLASRLAVTLPASLAFQSGSLRINGVVKTDATADDSAGYNAGTGAIFANLGVGATATAGGSIAQATNAVVVFRATIQPGSGGTTITLAPTVDYANGLATSWPLSVTAPPVSIGVVTGADLAVAVLATPSPLSNGSTGYDWTFTTTNDGPLPATAANVRITAPSNLNVWTINRTLGASTTECTYVSQTVRDCSFGTLPAGGSGTILVRAAVNTGQAYNSAVSVAAVASTTASDPNTANNNATNTARVADGTAPTAPGRPTASATTATQTVLTWTSSNDPGGSGVASYQVLRDGVVVGTVSAPTLTYTSTGLTAGTTYSYTIVAVDAAGNASAASPARLVVAVPQGNYKIFRDPVGGAGEYCMTATTTNNATLGMTNAGGCSSTNTRNWSFVASDGAVKIKMQNQDRYWTTATGTGNAVTSSATMTGTRQEWTMIPRAGGLFTFQSVSQPTKCLERTDTTVVSLATCNANTAAQQFEMTLR